MIVELTLKIKKTQQLRMKTILCYGDSNTWGYVPGAFNPRQRYDRNTRWTGLLQKSLGYDKFHVIEEGLNGRTTNLIYPDKTIGYCGTSFLEEVLFTHAPIDLVVIMLGMNDLKVIFDNRTSEHIAQGYKELIDKVRSTQHGPKMMSIPPILVVSTPLPVLSLIQSDNDSFKNARARVMDLSSHLESLVKQYPEEVYFVDAAPHVQISPIDGLHFDEKAHQDFAKLIHKKIEEIFN